MGSSFPSSSNHPPPFFNLIPSPSRLPFYPYFPNKYPPFHLSVSLFPIFQLYTFPVMSPYESDHESFCQQCCFDSSLESLTQLEIAVLAHRSTLVQGWKDHLDIRCSDIDRRTLLALLFHINSLKAQYNVNLLQIQEANGLHRIQCHQVR